jgi:UDP-glucose 4-epimerase
MTIVGDGEQKRDFTYVNDIVDANIAALNLNHQGSKIYNVGTGVNYSINQIAEMIGGEKVYIEERLAETRETLADIEMTKKDLSWAPRYDLPDMINSY